MCGGGTDGPADDDRIPLPGRTSDGAPAEEDSARTETEEEDSGVDAYVDPCSDLDDDGYIAKTCDGGLDCDDLDPRAFPDAAMRAEAGTDATRGDWNCNGVVEKLYPTNVTCFGATALACNSRRGFLGDPACGATGTYVQCVYTDSCEPGEIEQRVQQCR